MIGKKNIVFGFLYLTLTAALGPLMVIELTQTGPAHSAKQEALGRLEQFAANDFEEELEPMSAAQIAKANTLGLLALDKQLLSRANVDAIKSGPHAHGNLESVLNIAVGVVLGLLVIPAVFKQIISWVFIIGTLMHSGLLYLVVVFHQGWAELLLNTGIGPVLILLGLFLAGIASLIGLKKPAVAAPNPP